MKNNFWLFVILVWAVSSCNTEKRITRHEFTVMSYNVENLFDTIDDPKIPDEEFLPTSKKEWTRERYNKKLNDLAKVISEVNPKELPELIGLAEIENQTVLEDLIHAPELNNKYAIIHEESPDYRGIDVALLYRKDAFREITHEVLPVTFPDDPNFKTRDILHVTGLIGRKTVHVFVNHWPSRIGGDDKTEPKRVVAASVLKKKVDQILAEDPHARIIVMGDMNDEPENKSLKETLGAKMPGSGAPLVNLMMPDDDAGKGTYFFRGAWNMLDNLVVSEPVLKSAGMYVEHAKGYIFSNGWMTYTNKEGDKTPNRTYVGNKYVAGVSDHFPVYCTIWVR